MRFRLVNGYSFHVWRLILLAIAYGVQYAQLTIERHWIILHVRYRQDAAGFSWNHPYR